MKYSRGSERVNCVVVPLPAIRVPGGGCCGEYPDIVPMGKLALSWGFSMLQLLPVNDTGDQTSPYSALSAFALHPSYIRIRDLPELRDGKGREAGIALAASAALDARFAAADEVAFEEIHRAKLAILRDLWEASARLSAEAELESWCAVRGWIRAYSVFMELKRRSGGKPWWQWDEHRNPGQGFVDAFWSDQAASRDCRFWAWLQMRAEEQFSRAAKELAEAGIDIMGDIPILMNSDSADVWSRRGLFRMDRSAGAPPDMYSPSGQNWGFPLYDWEAMAAEGYAFWKERLAAADLFYGLYRIDHVLGFFRIWALSEREEDGFLGSYVPEMSISWPELAALGFSSERIRWLSLPHVPGGLIREACAEAGADAGLDDPRGVAGIVFSRIGGEDLFLFRDGIGGKKDIRALLEAAFLKAPDGARKAGMLTERFSGWWRDRALFECEPGRFVPSWSHGGTKAWASLSERERSTLESLIALRRGESLALWERSGRKILRELVRAVPMQACAEDLGAVPPCVPKVLGELGIPGLRVLRWHRDYATGGAPHVPFADYPEASVACPSVHDSSSLRQWWIEEAERESVWSLVRAALPDSRAGTPASLEPESATLFLEAFARVPSRILALPIQDLLAMSELSAGWSPASERVNVPGTSGGSNWRYRIPVDIGCIGADKALEERALRVSASRRNAFPATGREREKP